MRIFFFFVSITQKPDVYQLLVFGHSFTSGNHKHKTLRQGAAFVGILFLEENKPPLKNPLMWSQHKP